MEIASDTKLAKYFRSAFKQVLAESTLLVKFEASCLQMSGQCWEVWSGLGPSSPSSSTLLLKELSGSDLTPPPLPLDKVASVLTKVSQKIPEKDKEVAKVRLVCFIRDLNQF